MINRFFLFSTGGEYGNNMNTVDKSQIRSTKSTTKGNGAGAGGGGLGSSDWPEGNSPCKSLIINHPFTNRKKPPPFFFLSFFISSTSPLPPPIQSRLVRFNTLLPTCIGISSSQFVLLFSPVVMNDDKGQVVNE